MKSSSFWGFVFNPFTRIAGWQAFFVGLVFAALSGVVGTIGGVAFDGVLDAHIGGRLTYAMSFIMLGVDIAVTVLVMYLAGIIVSKTVRFVDVLGTMTLARAPLLLLAVAGLFVAVPSPNVLMAEPMALFRSASMIVFILFSIVISIWYIALMYNAMKVSCNISGVKLIVTFVIALFVAEVLSKIIIIYAITH